MGHGVKYCPKISFIYYLLLADSTLFDHISMVAPRCQRDIQRYMNQNVHSKLERILTSTVERGTYRRISSLPEQFCLSSFVDDLSFASFNCVYNFSTFKLVIPRPRKNVSRFSRRVRYHPSNLVSNKRASKVSLLFWNWHTTVMDIDEQSIFNLNDSESHSFLYNQLSSIFLLVSRNSLIRVLAKTENSAVHTCIHYLSFITLLKHHWSL